MARMKIIGVQEVSGKMENGITFDFARVYAVSMLDPANSRCSGFAGIEMRGVPDIYDKYLGFEFKPEGIEFEVRIEMVASGKGQFKDTIVEMIPVEMQQARAVIPPKAA